MRQRYRDWRPQAVTMVTVDNANAIIGTYQRDGFDLTLRQLYYQLVARDLFPDDRRWSWDDARRKWYRDPNGTKNADPNYKWLGGIVDSARLAGLMDWDAIVDRTRRPGGNDGFDTSPTDAIHNTAGGYRRALWETQPVHVETWVEKEALIGVVQRAASTARCNQFACRGYVSQSAMYRAGMRFRSFGRQGKVNHVLHLGDHDPSGIDMTRDIEERLTMFAGPYAPQVHRLALNMDQIEEWNPPPNPAKETDSRFESYREIHGDESWELDALDPTTLNDLIVGAVADLRDDGLWQQALQQEREERAQMQRVADQWDDVVDMVGTPQPGDDDWPDDGEEGDGDDDN